MTDGDMQALYAYLMSQPAVRQSNPANQMRFPFNLRPLMAAGTRCSCAGNFNPIRNKARSGIAAPIWSTGSATAPPAIRRAICWGRKGRRGFRGMVDGWEAPALNQLANADKPRTEEQLFQYFRSGHSAEHGVAAGPMGPVVSELATLPQSDLRAMANYVMSLSTKATLNVEPQAQLAARALPAAGQLAGERLFQGACGPTVPPPAGRSCSASARIWPITPISSAIAPIT